ncbi:MAG: alanine racemase [Pseudomonadota bacterium]
MKRRNLLGLGALGLLGLWAARPADRGHPHDAYFARLEQLLKREGADASLLMLDLDRLDANAARLTHSLAASGTGIQAPRLLVDDLASQGLLDYLSRRLNTARFMLFEHTRLNQLALAFPEADLLLGKPLPAAVALAFYRQLPNPSSFDPARQLTWLIDSAQRLGEYAELARALNQPLQIALEIDIGLAGGGFADPQALGQALTWLQADGAPLTLRGLMGDDRHIARTPLWVSQSQAFADSTARYRAFIATAQGFDLWPIQPVLNGASSLTYPLHTQGDSPLNELTVGSALLKPSDFDSELLARHDPVLWIASPVLKQQHGTRPYLEGVQALLQGWDRNREQTLYLDGGGWPAEPVSPQGLSYDELYGRTHQQRLLASAGTTLAVGDWVFLRPRVSTGLIGGFAELRLLRHDRLVGRWIPL